MSSFSSPAYASSGEPVSSTPLGWNDPPAELLKSASDEGQVARSRLLEQRRHQRPPLDPNIQVEAVYHQQQQAGGQYYGAHAAPGMQQRPVSASYTASPPPQQPPSHLQFAYQSPQVSPPQTQSVSSNVGSGQPFAQAWQHQPYAGTQFPPSAGGISLPTGLQHQQMGIHPASAFTPPALTQHQPQPPHVSEPQQSLDAASTIFSPPNTVCFDSDNRPQKRPSTQPDPHNYIPPTKAAGDVSLSGSQLIHFLVKATLRLQPGPIQEGIQLRLGQLHNEFNTGRVSDACLKRLNFVVDSIDRSLYDEASQFLDHMAQTFPQEMASTWAHGVRLLIGELKNGPNVNASPSTTTQLQHQQLQESSTPLGGRRVSSATPQGAHAGETMLDLR